jgi:hypothetical protein
MDIVTAIFVSNVKILASIRLKGNNDNIKVKIPTCEIFIHSIYIESAQQIYYDPKLFYHKNGNFNEIQKNKKYVREIIYSAVDESIRKMMPFDHILQEYLKNALDDNAEYTDSESSDSEPENESDDLLNNDKIINEPEEPEESEEPEQNTTKSLHIDGLNSYQIPNQEQKQPELNPYIQQPFTQQPLTTESYQPQKEGSDSGSDSGSSLSSYSDSDSYSGSDSDSDSGSSSESGSERSHPQQQPPPPSTSKENSHHHHKEHRHHNRHHEKEHGKHKYSFF